MSEPASSQKPDGDYAHRGVEEVREKASSGLRITSVTQAVRVVLQFGTQLALTHLIAPSAFGVVAMGLVLSGFATVLAQAGTQEAVVQRQGLTEEHLSAAFALNLCGVGAVAALLAGTAPLAADFYHQPEVRNVIWLLAAGIVVSALSVVHQGLLQRALRFKTLALIDLSAVVTASVVSVGLAVAHYPVLAIASTTVVVAMVTTTLSFATVRWRPRVWPTKRALFELLGFSAHLLNFNIINYWARNLDNLLVARVFGPRPAGLYTRAYSLLLLPLNQVGLIFGRVMYTSLAALQGDHARVRDAYLSSIGNVSALMAPLLALLALCAHDAVPLLLGPEWRAATSMVRVFALLGIVQCISTTFGWILLSQARTRLLSLLGVVNTVFYAAAFGLGVVLGSAFWVAFVYAVVNAAIALPTARVVYATIELPLRDVGAALAPVGVATAAMVPVVFLIVYLMRHSPADPRLAAELAAGAATYVSVGLLLRLPLVLSARAMVLRAVGKLGTSRR